MIRKAFFPLLLAFLAPLTAAAQTLVENEYFSLDLPPGWEAAPAQRQENGGLNINIFKSSGDCLITINIMHYAGGAEQLIREIGKTMAARGLIVGELRRDGDIWRCKFKQKENGGTLYVGANGRVAAMTSIYGSSRLQREAMRMLCQFRPKATALFPSFN